MDSTAFNSALNAFGGWPGILAFYFVGLAFPLRYAVRTLYAHDRHQMRQQSNELRKASFFILLGAMISSYMPSGLYLLRHVAPNYQMQALAVDSALTTIITYGIGPALGCVRVRRLVAMDRDGILAHSPQDQRRRQRHSGRIRGLLTQVYAQYFIESSWLLLFTLWLMNMAGGLLTVCVGTVIKQEILWWAYPIFNIGGHAAMLHAIVGVVEAFFHSPRVEITERGLDCQTSDASTTYWFWISGLMETNQTVARLLVMRSLPTTDAEQGLTSGGWAEGAGDKHVKGLTERVAVLVDDKAELEKMWA